MVVSPRRRFAQHIGVLFQRRFNGSISPVADAATASARSRGSVLSAVSNCGSCSRAPPQTVYTRPLPPSLISLSSADGKSVFRSSLISGHADAFFSLSPCFHTQSEPAYCGLASLVMVLNALGVDPGEVWKGPWRWFSEDLIVRRSWYRGREDVLRSRGVDLDEVAELAMVHGATVVSKLRPQQTTVDRFREDIRQCTSSVARFLVVNHSRAALGQTGDGHFSPVGAFDPVSDSCLVLDTARFKYPPYWVSTQMLWESLVPVDSATGRSRGYVVVEAAASSPASAGFGDDQMGMVASTSATSGAACASLAPEKRSASSIGRTGTALHEICSSLSAVLLAADFRRCAACGDGEITPDAARQQHLSAENTLLHLIQACPEELHRRMQDIGMRLLRSSCDSHGERVAAVVTEVRSHPLFAALHGVQRRLDAMLSHRETGQASTWNHCFDSTVMALLLLCIDSSILPPVLRPLCTVSATASPALHAEIQQQQDGHHMK